MYTTVVTVDHGYCLKILLLIGCKNRTPDGPLLVMVILQALNSIYNPSSRHEAFHLGNGTSAVWAFCLADNYTRKAVLYKHFSC